MCNKSCLTNLLETFEGQTRTVDEGHGVDVRLQQSFRLHPSQQIGFKTQSFWHSWQSSDMATNFPNIHFQRVVVNGCHSDWVNVRSGVPQGSALGQSYVSDIPNLIESNCKMFADDTKIYSVIKSFDYIVFCCSMILID